MTRQRDQLKASRKMFWRQRLGVAFLGEKKLVAQRLHRIAAVEQRRFEDRVLSKCGLDAWRVEGAVGLFGEISVAADVVGVGVGVVNSVKRPALAVEMLAHFAASFLVVAAVDEHDMAVAGLNDADLCRTLDVIGVRRDLDEFVHGESSFFHFLSV